jgi:hypothetical protein
MTQNIIDNKRKPKSKPPKPKHELGWAMHTCVYGFKSKTCFVKDLSPLKAWVLLEFNFNFSTIHFINTRKVLILSNMG